MKSSSRKSKPDKTGGTVGVFMGQSMIQAIEEWLAKSPERTRSIFLRDAAREKLRGEGIKIKEDQ